jgi:hypothetical protein
VIVPSRFSDDTAKNAGHVRVFKETAFGWHQLGQTLVGVHGAEHFGFSTAINHDGSIIAIGGIRHKGHAGIYQGRVSVFQLVREEDLVDRWELMGADLEGEDLLDYFGYSLSLCDSGKSLAVGAIQHVGSGDAWQGYASVYTWANENHWRLVGSQIEGKAHGDQQGNAVALNGAGNVVVTAAKFHNGPNGEDSGQVRVYRLSHHKWHQIGKDLDGEGAGDQFGSSVAISIDGMIVVVGAENNHGENGKSSGHVRVFRYDVPTEEWIQLGQDIDGEGDGHGSGVSVSIGGSTVAIGAIHANSPDGGVDGVGQVRLFTYSAEDDQWTQLGKTIHGKNELDHFGHSVFLTSDGSRVAISAPMADTEAGQDSGQIVILEVKDL